MGGQLVVAMEVPDPLHAPGFMQYGFARYAPDDLQHLLKQAGFGYSTIVHGDQLEPPTSIFGIARR